MNTRSIMGGATLADVAIRRPLPRLMPTGATARPPQNLDAMAELKAQVIAANAEVERLTKFIATGFVAMQCQMETEADEKAEDKAEEKAGPERAARAKAEEDCAKAKAECEAMCTEMEALKSQVAELTSTIAAERETNSRGMAELQRRHVTLQTTPTPATTEPAKRTYHVAVTARDGNGFGSRFSISTS